MLDTLIASVKEKHKQKPITPEAYHKWRMSGVTKRLMEEIEIQTIEMMTYCAGWVDITKAGAERQGDERVKDMADNILAWKPSELVEEDDD